MDEVVKRAQRGDLVAFEHLARDVLDRLHGVARSILGDAALADDATQSALLAIWRELPQLRDPARFGAWSYRVLVRACYAEGRRARRWLPAIPDGWPRDGAEVDPHAAIHDRDELERGFRRLSLEQRAVLVLHHYLDLPLDEVAVVLGIPPGTAHSRLHRAHRALRAALDADGRPAALVGAGTGVAR